MANSPALLATTTIAMAMTLVINDVFATPFDKDNLDYIKRAALVNADVCGFNKYGVASDKIVGGHESKPNSFPWLVSLWYDDDYYETDSHQCGAVAINKQFLLTAAHCFAAFSEASRWRAVLGEHDFTKAEGTEVWRNVEKIIVHEKYDAYDSIHDIALIKLSSPLEKLPSDDLTINTICLPAADDDFTGMNCKVAGWGRLRDYGELPNVLQEVKLPVFGWEKCNDYRFYKNRVWETNICAGFDEGGKDSCQGDSGGPLMCTKSDGKVYLAGIVSWGMGCAMRNSPGVYTDPTKYVDWIGQSVKNNS